MAPSKIIGVAMRGGGEPTYLQVSVDEHGEPAVMFLRGDMALREYLLIPLLAPGVADIDSLRHMVGNMEFVRLSYEKSDKIAPEDRNRNSRIVTNAPWQQRRRWSPWYASGNCPPRSATCS